MYLYTLVVQLLMVWVKLGLMITEATMPQLKPLNPYGQSKQDFDVWALSQERKPYFWVGLKFFNAPWTQ